MWFIIVAVLSCVASSFAQEAPTCQCSLQLTAYLPLPVFSGSIHELPVRNVTGECGERDQIDCDYWCATDVRDFIAATNFNDPKPGDSLMRTWGKYLCDGARVGAEIEIDAITAELEGHDRLCNTDPDFWVYIYDTGRLLCCDQIGNHVDC